MNAEKNDPLKALVDYFGSAYKAAQAMNVSQSHFSIWKKQGFIPWKRADQIEALTEGAIKAIEIREYAANRAKIAGGI